jgi:hypothetical protein
MPYIFFLGALWSKVVTASENDGHASAKTQVFDRPAGLHGIFRHGVKVLVLAAYDRLIEPSEPTADFL